MTKLIKLSERLTCIAEQVPTGARVADIGSDHALLPCCLVQKGQVDFAIAGEVNPGPLEAAKKQVREEGLEGSIQVRSGDGLAVIQPGEVNVITIAGMGGSLIVKILSAGAEQLAGVERLVLQPNVGEDHVREWLIAEQWKLIDELILEEDGKFYEILVAVKAQDAAEHNEALFSWNPLHPYGVEIGKEQLVRMGPYLLQGMNEAFGLKWVSEKQKLERIVHTLKQSDTDEARAKEQAFMDQIRQIEEVLACMLKDRC